MRAPAYDIAAADAGVQAVLGNPPRFHAFGEAPQGEAQPYAVWQVVGGSPENYLAGRPDSDFFRVQVDVYAKDAPACRPIVEALVEAFELVAYVTSWNGEFRDPDTKLFRVSFTVEFIPPR